MVAFASMLCIGQVVVTIGLSIKSWPVMFLGRILYGFGGESIGVSNSAILAGWFKGKELAFAFGLNLSIARLGSVINNVVSPTLESSVSIEFAFWFGSILCGGCLLATLFVFPIDKKMEELVKSNLIVAKTNAFDKVDRTRSRSTSSIHIDDDIKLSDALKLSFTFWVLTMSCAIVYGCILPFNNIASSLLQERDYFIAPDSGCHLRYEGCQNSTNVPVGCQSSEWYQVSARETFAVFMMSYTQLYVYVSSNLYILFICYCKHTHTISHSHLHTHAN